MKPIVYVLHPGEVNSNTDGQSHFISIERLKKLYRLKLSDDYQIYDPPYRNYKKNPCIQYIHLYPDPTGQYIRPNELGDGIERAIKRINSVLEE